jgi:hypothetical protein
MNAATENALNDLEPLICEADDMVDVLMGLMEPEFAKARDDNLVLTSSEVGRIFFVLCQCLHYSRKVRRAYYAAWEVKDEGGAK